MKEQIISFKTAKLAKKKGFDWETKLGYCTTDEVFPIGHVIINSGYGFLLAPAQYLLQKWIREKHNIHIDVEANGDDDEFPYYVFMVYACGKDRINYELDVIAEGFKDTLYKTYEDALDKGLIKALKLIKTKQK